MFIEEYIDLSLYINYIYNNYANKWIMYWKLPLT